MAVAEKGKVAHAIYRLLVSGLSPFLFLHLQWRRFRGLEHPLRWRERFGHPSSPRPPGPLLWFHAVSLGEGMAAIPIIKRCLQEKPNYTILMTTTTLSAFDVIKDKLPNSIIYQFSPIDTPATMDAFLQYWDPKAVFLIESELWPNLVLYASQRGIRVALLNARISATSLKHWSAPVVLPLISLMLSKFSLIAPLSTVEAIRYQLLQAPPSIIHFAGDLKYAVGDIDITETESRIVEDMQQQFKHRLVWMLASLHKGEEKVALWAHKELIKVYPDMITVIAPRHPEQGEQIALALKKEGLNFVLRSHREKISSSTSIYIVDTLVWPRISFLQGLIFFPHSGELRSLYRLIPVAVIGGSFLPGLAGHNISEAAAAGCAVLTGPYVGHFSQMVVQMKRFDQLSVQQVSGKLELVEVLKELLNDAEALDACRTAAKKAFLALSCGVVDSVWQLINIHVLEQDTKSEKKILMQRT